VGMYRNWFLASRPWSFSMTAISVSVGSALAAMDGNFYWGLYLITLVGMIFLHAATNLINDYFDVRREVDTLDVSTAQYRPHPLLEGKLKPQQVIFGSFLLYGLAAIAGLYLAALRGWVILGIGLIGVIASFTYTAPPLKYKYCALGELSVFLMWGPLMVEGAYFVQRQSLSEAAFWVSLPFGGLVALVLLVNNLRDMVHDREKDIRTLPILIGRKNGLRLYGALIAFAYVSVLWMSFLGPLHLWSLIVLLSLPLAYRLLCELVREIPADADACTAQLDTAFGILLVISLILERLV
jgi:1,4-dihydroxy-2-naphthoate octaprenyltransferase